MKQNLTFEDWDNHWFNQTIRCQDGQRVVHGILQEHPQIRAQGGTRVLD